MSRPRVPLPSSLRRRRRAYARPRPATRRDGLAARITALADDLASVIDDAADLRLVAPTAVTNTVLDLRAWSVRVLDDHTTRPTAVDATRLLAHVRALPDRQLLALLGDLPWSRLDTLLDAVNELPATERLPAQTSRSDSQSHPAVRLSTRRSP
jgi:hypothetical protein